MKPILQLEIFATDLDDLKNRASFIEINGDLVLTSSSFRNIMREDSLNRAVKNNEIRLLEGLRNA